MGLRRVRGDHYVRLQAQLPRVQRTSTATRCGAGRRRSTYSLGGQRRDAAAHVAWDLDQRAAQGRCTWRRCLAVASASPAAIHVHIAVRDLNAAAQGVHSYQHYFHVSCAAASHRGERIGGAAAWCGVRQWIWPYAGRRERCTQASDCRYGWIHTSPRDEVEQGARR